jgi:CRP-like cAMP-binding protein
VAEDSHGGDLSRELDVVSSRWRLQREEQVVTRSSARRAAKASSPPGEAERQPIALEQRIRLLRELPGLGASDPDLAELAGALHEAAYAPGEVVFREGEAGDFALIIATGTARLTAAGPWTTVELASLGPGEIVGELALVLPDRKRNATLAAATTVRGLVLDRDAYQRFIAGDQRRRDAFEQYAAELLIARFIREVDPFAALADRRRRALAKRVRRRQIGAGELLVKRGEPGHTCMMLRSGSAEVLQPATESANAVEQRVAVIEAGEMIGEAALLTGGPRNATVRALEPCELLELHSDDLFEIARGEPRAARGIVHLFRLRSRPAQAEGVIASEWVNAEGETITVLKNPARMTYYRLSPRGRFIWDRMDGSLTVRDLTVEYGRELGSVTPQIVAGVVVRLARAGMLKDASIARTPLDPEQLPEHGRSSLRTRVAKLLRRRPD